MPFLTVRKSVAEAVGDKPKISLPLVSLIRLALGLVYAAPVAKATTVPVPDVL